MSNKYYNQKWQETINEIQDLVQMENVQTDPDFLKNPAPDLFQYYAQNYIRYVDIYKRLEDCYDQIVHPQKRINLKELLELSIVRMIENKKLVIQYNTHSNSYQSDMVNLDELITDLKLTPDKLEVPIPRYFRKEAPVDERNQIINKLLMEFHDTDQPEEVVVEEQNFTDVSSNTLISMIQTNERGRQGIERVMQALFYKKQEHNKIEKNKRMLENTELTQEQEDSQTSLIFQKYWRGYVARAQVYKLRMQELEFLGIRRTEESDIKAMNEQRLRMSIIQQQHQKEYVAAQESLKKLVQENEGPEIKEKKIKERIEWIDQYLDKTEGKKLPARATDFYDVKKRLPPSAEELEALKGGKKGKKEEKKSEKKGKKGKKDAKDDKKDSVNLATVVKINEQVDQYMSTWGSINDADNYQQQYVTEVAKGLKRKEVELQMNGLVDELIEIELDNRHMFLLKKPRKKPKPIKPPKPPKPPKFKVPGVASCRGKNPLDMLSELIDFGIVKKLMPAQLQDLQGGLNFLGVIQEQQFATTPDPSYAQLRTGIAEYIAMPLGSPFLKASLDRLAFFMFFGPTGSGKTLALRALATECNAMLLDLTPSNIAGRCTDKTSIGKTFYMTFAVAKHFGPSIIYMDELEQVFGSAKKRKGIPAAAWAKLKKPLQDFKKAKFIEAASRVCFIGCTNSPLTCVMKDTKNFFDKKFFFPILNYDTRLTLLQKFIEDKGVQLEVNFPLSTLAHLTEGYTAGSFKAAIDKVLTANRIKRIQEDPLRVNEFVMPLAKCPYVKSQQEYETIRVFFDEVTGTKDKREKAKALLADPKGSKKPTKKK